MRGSIRERRPGIFEVRLYVGLDPVTGQEVRRSKTVRGPYADAEVMQARMVTEAQDGAQLATKGTVAYLLDEWLAFAQGDLSPTTMRTYRGLVKNWVKPAFGTKPLAKLSARDCDKLYRKMTAAGRAGSTVHQAHAVIHRACAQAVRWGWIPANPVANATPPRVASTEVTLPTVEVLMALASDDDELLTLVLVKAALGARRGEMCGLRWRDVDLESGVVVISHAVVLDGKTPIMKDTKTHAERRLKLDPPTIARLRAHRARQEELAAEAGARIGPNSFLFSVSGVGDKPMNPELVTKRFARLRKRNGLDGVRLHDLRHLNASLLLNAGVSIETVSKRLGHRKTSTTLDIYSWVMPGSDEAAAEVLGQLLGGSAPKESLTT